MAANDRSNEIRLTRVYKATVRASSRAPAPGAESWPATLRNTVLFTEETPDRTRVTVTTEPHGDATAMELEAFVRERPGMTLDWTASFDALERRMDSGVVA